MDHSTLNISETVQTETRLYWNTPIFCRNG